MNIIFGKRSNLSIQLADFLEDAILLSAENADNLFDYHKKNIKINIIINSFQKSTDINKFGNPTEYISKTLVDLSKIIEVISKIKESVDTVIYSSSASVYGDNSNCKEDDNLYPVSLYSSLKISSEILIKSCLSYHGVNYTIARIFNLYGGSDSFSVISKIIKSSLNDELIYLFNNGLSKRDFIHIQDVCAIYKKLLEIKYCGYINVGTGKSNNLKKIVSSLKQHSVSINVEYLPKKEINESVASIEKLSSIIKVPKFIDVNEYTLNVIKSKNN